MEDFEQVFKTTLLRHEAIETKVLGKGFEKLSWCKKDRLRNSLNNAERIIEQMYFKRVIEPNLIKTFRENYITITDIEPNNFLPVDADGDLFADVDSYGFVYIQKTDLSTYISKLWLQVCNEIEQHNYKLFTY